MCLHPYKREEVNDFIIIFAICKDQSSIQVETEYKNIYL